MLLLDSAKKVNTLYDDLSISPSVLGKRVDFLYDYLSSEYIYDLTKVTPDILRDFITHVRKEFTFNKNKASSYKGDLETVYLCHMQKIGHPLLALDLPKTPQVRKCLTFLMASGITSVSGISARTRKDYENYLNLSVPAKISEYIKVLDRLVLSEIEKINIPVTPSYKNELFFLGYYPDLKISKRFYYSARKEFLYFDFSINAPLTLKIQIFSSLMAILLDHAALSNHYLIQHFITPLHYLYDFCISQGISDIKRMADEDSLSFKAYLDKNMDAVNNSAFQVLFRTRKFLFLNDEKPDFKATCWFLERFDLRERANPTRGTECFNFGDIKGNDRTYLMHFMKYLIVLSPKYSLQSILEKYFSAKDFIRHLKTRKSDLSELSYSDIESYIDSKQKLGLKPQTYNGILTRLSFFLSVLSVREKLLIPSFPFDYFYQKENYLHHDRSVPEEKIDRIMTVLSDFPEKLGLMFLTLYSTGLRINEVCSIKRDALFTNGTSCWLNVYQYKMRSDKQIPIPKELYRLLKRHTTLEKVSSPFIFPSCSDNNKPYQAETFVKQMKAQLSLYEETKDIAFKSHDFRHTIATDIHMSGAPIQTTRAFLGHVSEDMTKQYIDHLPGHIEMLQDKYFKENAYENDV